MAKLRKRKLRNGAFGFGDVMLAGIVGLILGWPEVLLGLLLTFVITGIVSFLYVCESIVAREYRFDKTIPFSPFFITSLFILTFGNSIV